MKAANLLAIFLLALFVAQALAAEVDCEACSRVQGTGVERCSDLQAVGSNTDAKTAFCQSKCEYDQESFHNQCTFYSTDASCSSGAKCADGSCCGISIEEVNIGFTEEYIKETKENRGFDPREWGITPFDDIACNVKILVCEAEECVKKAKEMPKEGRLTTSHSSEDVIVLQELAGESLGYVGSVDAKDEGPACKYLLYRWQVKGWAEGKAIGLTTDEEKMKKLVEAGNISCTVSLGSPAQEEVTSPAEEVLPCVNVKGKLDADFSLAFLQDQSSPFTLSDLIFDADKIRELGFDEISPFKENKEKFSFRVDLRDHLTYPDSVKGIASLKKFIAQEYDLGCGWASYNFLVSKPLPERFRANGATSPGLDTIVLSPFAPVFTAVHEMGHALCLLDDERSDISDGRKILNTNCKYKKDLGFFPDNGFIPFGDHFLGCTNTNAYRAASRSIMDGGSEGNVVTNFNVVGCGYCLYRIRGGNPLILRGAMNDCCAMENTIKPLGHCGDT